VTSSTTVGATASSQADDVTGTPNNDVWFSFTATSTSHVISLLNVVNLGGGTSTSTDMGIGLYDASSGCGSLVFNSTSDPDTYTATGLTSGNLYVVRVYGWFSSVQNNNFDICIGTDPPCATPGSPSALTFGAVSTSTIDGSFTEPVPNADNYLVLMNTTGTAPTNPTNGVIYTIGDTSLGATVVDNDGNANFTTTGLTDTTTYYFFVYAYNNAGCSGGPAYSVTSTNNNIATMAPLSNDDCSSPTALTVNTDLNCGSVTAGTTDGATASSQADDVSGTPNNDVWFSFTATATSHIISLLNIVNLGGGTSTSVDMGIGLYDATGGCGSLIYNSTSDPNSYTANGLTIGNLYVVRVYGWFSSVQNNNFDICIGTEPPCAPPTAPSALTATAISSTIINGNFTEPIPNANNYLVLMNTTGTAPTNPVNGTTYALADTSLGATVVDNDGDANFTATGLNPNTDYYFFVFAYNNTACTGGPIYNLTSTTDNETTLAPLSNDECASAIALTVNPDFLCGTVTPGTIDGASASGGDTTTCFGSENDDVWFSFVATATSHNIDLINVANGTTDLYHSVWSGACGALTNINCSDPNSSSLTGLTIGNTYFLRVNSWTATPGQTTTFDVCIGTPVICVLPAITDMPGSGIIIDETTNDPFTATPFVADPNADLGSVGSCGGSGGSVTLEAHARIKETTSYAVEQIDYFASSPAFNSISNILVPINIDDQWTLAPTDMSGFDFCFYGQSIDQSLMGPNGQLTFDLVNNTPGTSCGYSFDENIPSTDEALFNQTIYSVYHDLDPSASLADYTFTRIDPAGADGCRKLIFGWVDVPMYSDNTILYTGAIVLYEFTNIIEVYIEEKHVDGGAPWNDGNGLVGVQGIAALGEATAAPCRNTLDTNWDTSFEAWRFVPDGTSIAPTATTWHTGGSAGPQVGAGTTFTANTANTYTAVSTYTNCTGNIFTLVDDIVVSGSGGKLWDGSESDDWTNPLNWSDNLVPTIADCVVIPAGTPNNPIIRGGDDGSCLSLTISNGAVLTLDNNTADTNYATVTVQDYLNLQGNSTLYVQNNSSLVQINESGPNVNNNLGTGTLVMDRDTNIRNTDYVYWSSPISNFSLSNIYGANTPNYTYRWIPTIAAGFTPPPSIPICFGDWASYTGNMNIGNGYISRAPNGHPAGPAVATATFSGTPNNGVVTQAITSGDNDITNTNFTYNPNGVDILTVTPLDDNWNLIGNPYPSAISADDFLTDPSNALIEGSVHIWTHGTDIYTNPNNIDSFYEDFGFNYNPNDYITYNLSGVSYPNATFAGYIASGQAFFVLSLNDNETGNVTFSNSMRSNGHDNSNFYRSSSDDNPPNTIERHRIWLNLIGDNQNTSSTLVGYIEGATQEKDRLYDAYTFESNSLSIYSKIDDYSMAIQGRQLPFDYQDRVPLGVDIPENGNYIIAIGAVDGLFDGDNGQDIYLEDTYTGIIHDLRISPYSFNIEQGTYNERFVLRYTNEALSVDDFENTSDLVIYIEDELVKLKSEINSIDSVIVYNVLGQTLTQVDAINSLSHTLQSLRPSNGILFVKAILNDGRQKIQKIIY
jgi:hypothetical protein